MGLVENGVSAMTTVGLTPERAFAAGAAPRCKHIAGESGHRTIRIAGLHLFERGSTAHVPPATVLVEKARAYIAGHACEGTHVDDVVSHLGVSRSLLDLRFRQMCGKSVLEDILDVRLAEVRRQLVKTDHTILQIGRDCGFNDPDNLKRLFKSRYGLSMRTWRKANTLGPWARQNVRAGSRAAPG